MGKDIHMFVLDDVRNEILKEEIFEGRNSEWFSNISGDGWDQEYDYLPIKYGMPEEAPKKFQCLYEHAKQNFYFDFRYFTVGEFKTWYEKYKPALKAGWASVYEEWKYKNKNICPKDLPTIKPDDNDEYVFMEYEDNYDCSKWLYEYIKENHFLNNVIIFYYFDC